MIKKIVELLPLQFSKQNRYFVLLTNLREGKTKIYVYEIKITFSK